MPAPASLQLCCTVAELEGSPALAIDILQQFQTEGADDDWIHIATANNNQLVLALTRLLNNTIEAAAPPPHVDSPADLLAPLLVADLALYSALVNLVFIFASLSSHTVCPILLQYDIVNIPLVVGSPSDQSAAAIDPLTLLRLQLLALTISSYPDSISPPQPQPLILRQTLSLLTHVNDDIQLAASACVFLLLSISSLPLSMPALLSHPNLPAFLTAIQSLLVAAPSTGYSSPFLPLSLTVLGEMAACLALLQQKGDALPVPEASLLEVWDGVCELLEENSGGTDGRASEGMDADVRKSTLDCLYSLLSIPSMQQDVMLQQYSTYKRRYRHATTSQSGAEPAQRSEPTATVTTAEKPEQHVDSGKRHSLNPFDDDPSSPDALSASVVPASSSLQSVMPFTAGDFDAVLNSAPSSTAPSPSTLVAKIEQLSSLLDGPATRDDWLTYLDSTQYRLLLVLAYLYTQDGLPSSSSSSLLSILLSLSSLSSTCQGVTSAVLSHPSLIAVLLSQLTQNAQAASVVVRLQVLYFVYSSQSSPALDADNSQSLSSPVASDGIIGQLLPLLASDDDSIVALAVYVLLLSHQQGTPVPAAILSLTDNYSFQTELLQLVNRGALNVASPPTSNPLDQSSTDAQDRSDIPALLRVALVFLLDLLSTDAGVQWVYTNDLYVLVDVLLQRIEDQQAVSEAEVTADETFTGDGDVVVLCERVLLALLEHWKGWQANGGYKRRQMQQLMEQVERECGADESVAKVKRVYSSRVELASRVLTTLSSIGK